MTLKSPKIDNSNLVIRLERNQNDLSQLKSLLSSYTCEPKTLPFFERIEFLKHKLEDLSKTNEEIIQSLKEHSQSAGTFIEKAKQQFDNFNLLQKGVEEYIAGVRKC